MQQFPVMSCICQKLRKYHRSKFNFYFFLHIGEMSILCICGKKKGNPICKKNGAEFFFSYKEPFARCSEIKVYRKKCVPNTLPIISGVLMHYSVKSETVKITFQRIQQLSMAKLSLNPLRMKAVRLSAIDRNPFVLLL